MSDPREGLTKEQVSMIDGCIQNDAAWMTVKGTFNHELLLKLEKQGFVVVGEMPDAIPDSSNLACYFFTDAGKKHFGPGPEVEMVELKDVIDQLNPRSH